MLHDFMYFKCIMKLLFLKQVAKQGPTTTIRMWNQTCATKQNMKLASSRVNHRLFLIYSNQKPPLKKKNHRKFHREPRAPAARLAYKLTSNWRLKQCPPTQTCAPPNPWNSSCCCFNSVKTDYEIVRNLVFFCLFLNRIIFCGQVFMAHIQ